MTDEVELKAKVDSVEEMAGKITKSGGRFVREALQEDRYFRHPCRDLKGRDEALRLRWEGDRHILAFKGRRSGSGVKRREEVEVAVDDGKGAAKLLERLGFEEALVIRKKRRIYALGGSEVALDSVEGLGEYAEIEVMIDGEASSEGAMGKIYEVARKLGIPMGDLTSLSYLELLESKSSSSRA